MICLYTYLNFCACIRSNRNARNSSLDFNLQVSVNHHIILKQRINGSLTYMPVTVNARDNATYINPKATASSQM